MSLKEVLVLSSLILCLKASPFEITDAYVENFKHGLAEMKTLSKEYKYEQQNLPEIHSESGEAKEYDFVIVGSGTSGSVIANRLSEIPEWKILLLEAGSPETETSQVPSMYPYLQTTPYDWAYTTVPQEHSCLGMDEHQCSIPSGKAVGGNTAVNDMLYIRGNQKDYDIWADLGPKGWCWNDVFPYFKKIEDAHIPELDRKYHSLGGPVHLERFQHYTGLQPHLLEAAHEIGIKTVDFNGKEQLGIGIPQAITKNGKRNSVGRAYLTPALKRSNIEIIPQSQAVQILTSPHTQEAYGVKFLHGGKIFVAKAAKEVIIAAGAVETPKLLMLSGIGPKEQLEHLEIEPVADVKVGHNLKDHVAFIGLNFIFNETHEDGLEKDNAVMDYLRNGKGPLAFAGTEAIAFVKTEASKDPTHYPDVQLIISRDIYNKGHEHLRSLRIAEGVYDAVWKPIEGHKGFTIKVVLLHPKSSGIITLHDKDPLHHPLIDPKSLTDLDEHDELTILAGIKKALKLAHTEALQKLGIHLNEHKVPDCEHYEKEEYWRCAIKYLSINLGDISGTARMGPTEEADSVVDEHLRVKGVHKLRVADASVIPVTISGNLMAPTIMIGERAADLIKEDWK